MLPVSKAFPRGSLWRAESYLTRQSKLHLQVGATLSWEAASLGLPWAPIPSPEVPADVSHLRSHTQHTPGHSPLCWQTAQVWISKTEAWLYPREPVSAVSRPGLRRARRHPAASLCFSSGVHGAPPRPPPPTGTSLTRTPLPILSAPGGSGLWLQSWPAGVDLCPQQWKSQ